MRKALPRRGFLLALPFPTFQNAAVVGIVRRTLRVSAQPKRAWAASPPTAAVCRRQTAARAPCGGSRAFGTRRCTGMESEWQIESRGGRLLGGRCKFAHALSAAAWRMVSLKLPYTARRGFLLALPFPTFQNAAVVGIVRRTLRVSAQPKRAWAASPPTAAVCRRQTAARAPCASALRIFSHKFHAKMLAIARRM